MTKEILLFPLQELLPVLPLRHSSLSSSPNAPARPYLFIYFFILGSILARLPYAARTPSIFLFSCITPQELRRQRGTATRSLCGAEERAQGLTCCRQALYQRTLFLGPHFTFRQSLVIQVSRRDLEIMCIHLIDQCQSSSPLQFNLSELSMCPLA